MKHEMFEFQLRDTALRHAISMRMDGEPLHMILDRAKAFWTNNL